jgi:hypothetical protein
VEEDDGGVLLFFNLIPRTHTRLKILSVETPALLSSESLMGMEDGVQQILCVACYTRS